jgi:hypothetical protein
MKRSLEPHPVLGVELIHEVDQSLKARRVEGAFSSAWLSGRGKEAFEQRRNLDRDLPARARRGDVRSAVGWGNSRCHDGLMVRDRACDSKALSPDVALRGI